MKVCEFFLRKLKTIWKTKLCIYQKLMNFIKQTKIGTYSKSNELNFHWNNTNKNLKIVKNSLKQKLTKYRFCWKHLKIEMYGIEVHKTKTLMNNNLNWCTKNFETATISLIVESLSNFCNFLQTKVLQIRGKTWSDAFLSQNMYTWRCLYKPIIIILTRIQGTT